MTDKSLENQIGSNVAVIGTGYVGLVSGACLAEVGRHVVCLDQCESKIDMLRAGAISIYEPGLDAIVRRNAAAGRLTFTTQIDEALRWAEIVILAVGTPTRAFDGNADLRYIYAASREIARVLDHYALIVIKSTVPAGTAHEVRRIIERESPGLDFDVASNPEFLREGSAVCDFMNPDRIVIGTGSRRARERLEALYRPFTDRGVELIATDTTSSELIKYAANTFLATKVSFINEMADICEGVGGDIDAVARGMGSDRRIGHEFLKPGPGYGGSCFPKDTFAMVHIGDRALSPATIVEAVMTVNRSRLHRMVAKIVNAAGGSVDRKTIGILGLTFKPNTDDVRDSVAILVAEQLVRNGAVVKAYDPKGMANARDILGETIGYCASVDDAIADADLCVIATEWDEFVRHPIERYRTALRTPVVVDLRNVFSLAAMASAGLDYHSIGRASIRRPALRPFGRVKWRAELTPEES